ncbi:MULTISPECIES: DNA repair protein RecO [Porphyromonadaceae]|uniref:DNA recombination protein RecO n=1 Tax=Sanguibacteroides justesenii TaxID=1547597 RepID=A0AB34R570_9PORP|nr:MULTISPECIES: DNA repair protein RecO [Porphyromonadaceae]KIO45350.1 DNA recombination protein RecO [Sanguibacteroides justesenii]PXZ44638.1 DNA repair protein RecO [Sanguibacteroides justesenii]
MEVTNAIVLKNIPYTENQRILSVFSAERGFLSLITPVNTIKRRNNHATQCMQIVEIEYIFNEKNNIHKLTTIVNTRNTTAIYLDVYKMNIALLWGEILNLTLRNEGKNETLYEYIENSIEYLNSAQRDIANFNLFFLFHLASLLGFDINSSTYRPGYILNLNDGNFYPTAGNDSYSTGPHAAQAIYKLCNSPLADIGNIPLNRQSRSIILDILLLFLSFHLNINFNIKSIKVIREIFS